MKKRSLSFLTILVLSLVITTGCQKDDDNPPAAKTKTELLTQANWQFSSATFSGADVSNLLEDCQKDNSMTFTSSGSGTLDEGATKCDSGDPQTVNFTWNFATSETVLHVSTVLFTGGSSDFTIVTLSETQLVVSQVLDLSGSPQTVVVTFTH